MAVTPNATPAVRAQQVRHYLSARAVPSLALEGKLAFLCELIGAPLAETERPYLAEARADARLMNDRLRETWQDWFADELEDGPVLCVLDDVQWSDPATLRFLTSALQRFEEHAILLFVIARPEVRDLAPQLWNMDTLTHVVLKPISPPRSWSSTPCETAPSSCPRVCWPWSAPD